MSSTDNKISKYIDSVATCREIMACIGDIQLVEFTGFVLIEYRACAIDINFEKYFADELSMVDIITCRIINLDRHIQREIFSSTWVGQETDTKLEEMIAQHWSRRPSSEKMEHIDHVITKVLEIFYKVEGPRRCISLSKEKIIR